MITNITSGVILKGSDVEFQIQLASKCYSGATFNSTVVNFYTTDPQHSIEQQLGDLTSKTQTVHLQGVELEALNDGVIRYTSTFDDENGEEQIFEAQTSLYLKAPIQYTPIDFASTEYVDEAISEAIITGATYSAGTNIDITDRVISVTGMPDVSHFVTSADVKTQVEAYDYATESQIPDVSEFVTSADVKTQVEAYDYATESQIPDVSNFVTSGDVKTQVETYNYVNSGDVKTQVEAYNYVTSGDVKTQVENYHYTTSADVATQVETYHYTTTGEVQSQIEATLNPDIVILIPAYASGLFTDPSKVSIWYEDCGGRKMGDLTYDSVENRYIVSGLSLPYGEYALRATVQEIPGNSFTVWKNGELVTATTLDGAYLADSWPYQFWIIHPSDIDYSSSPLRGFQVALYGGQYVSYGYDTEGRPIPKYAGGQNIYIESPENPQGFHIINVTGITSFPGFSAMTSGDVTDALGYTPISAVPDTYATTTYVDNSVSGKQETLVSGENIKTINNQSILGSGNITISGGTGGTVYTAGNNIEITQEDVINVTGITSYPGYNAISGDIKSQIEDYHYVTSGDVKTQVESYNYVTSGDVSTQLQTNHYTTSEDVATQVEAYHYTTSGDVQNQVTAVTSTKQDTLVSGTNIKTINGESLLGSGNITITGGSGSTIYTAGDNINISDQNVIAVTGITSYTGINSSDVTTALGYTPLSAVPDTYATTTYVDNSVSGKQDTIVAGNNIAINSNTVSVTGITSYPGYDAISGDVASQVEVYGYATTGYVQDAISGITGGTTYTAGDNIQITNQDVISVTGITSYPGYDAISGDIATQIEGYGYATQSQIPDVSGFVTSGDVATQVENYHYTTSGDVQSQITGATTGFQETLVSGQNIKTVNTSSLLGSGNLEVGDVRGNGVTGLWTGTQAQYDAITAKSNTILYFIHE